MKKRIPTSGSNNLSQVPLGIVWTLESGRKIKFKKERLSYEEVVQKTVVDFEVNGRDQDLLNEMNLSDLDTMKYQQFYPVIMYRYNDALSGQEKLNFLDGSRRKEYFLLQKGAIPHLDALVTDEQGITPADAKALAKALQSAKEHTLYEIGVRAATYKDKGLTQDEIAKELGYSRTKIVRALQAASVSKEIYFHFDDINELTVKDYTDLYKLFLEVKIRDDSAELIKTIKSGNVESVMAQIKQLVILPKKKTMRTETTALIEFKEKNKYAKKRKKGRNFGYDFSHLTAEDESILDNAIQIALEQIRST
ncbi:hypothetical protein C9J12_27045 [Photobacterium frigidiphilum]|uniref:ParB protein family C-terminal domain-containing protein n=1 Tax=Photobacterium frigidiphilum TaxID=264736 RepID=A0A2T3J711_9GAMM|nr:ParB family protein [Photobacterium frigidiphilum]PSU44529.1 hypothetical protein C9J12_27045 [Photobacterium frigidiphilum]